MIRVSHILDHDEWISAQHHLDDEYERMEDHRCKLRIDGEVARMRRLIREGAVRPIQENVKLWHYTRRDSILYDKSPRLTSADNVTTCPFSPLRRNTLTPDTIVNPEQKICPKHSSRSQPTPKRNNELETTQGMSQCSWKPSRTQSGLERWAFRFGRLSRVQSIVASWKPPILRMKHPSRIEEKRISELSSRDSKGLLPDEKSERKVKSAGDVNISDHRRRLIARYSRSTSPQLRDFQNEQDLKSLYEKASKLVFISPPEESENEDEDGENEREPRPDNEEDLSAEGRFCLGLEKIRENGAMRIRPKLLPSMDGRTKTTQRRSIFLKDAKIFNLKYFNMNVH